MRVQALQKGKKSKERHEGTKITKENKNQ